MIGGFKTLMTRILLVLVGFGVGVGILFLLPKAPELVGGQVASFTLRSYDGTVIYTEELKGKPVVLNFWAAWCTFCRQEMPVLERLYKKYESEDLVIIGVHRSSTESREQGLRFAREEMGVTYPLVSDPNDNIFNYFTRGSYLVPVTIFIDREGVIQEVIIGPRHEDQFESILENIL